MKTNDEITGVCVGSTGADEPLVSVIIPVYNVRDYLADCIRSVLDQTYPRVECICVDDGSTDGSGELLDELVGGGRREVGEMSGSGSGSGRDELECDNG